MRLFSPSRERYVELEEAQSVLVPLRTTHMLLPEHFATPLAKLRFPTRLDFSHDRFKLRSLALLSLLRESALVEMVLAENELSSLDELNRFHALKILLAPRNTLESVEGVRLSLPRLVRLDLNENQLREVPPLKGVPSLQVLSLSRNRIARGWPELVHCANLQGLDVSFNKLDWSPSSGEMSKAMAVLRGLRRLRVFQIQGNPVCEHNELRSWVLANAPRIELLDVKSARAIAEKAAAAAGSAAADGKEEGDGDTDGDGEGRAPTPSRRLLGMPLHKVAGDEDLPELVQECARHVQERGAPTLQLLTAEGNASLVLQLRNGFERSTAEGIATLERLEDADHNDVRAACGLLRRFLLELPEPLIPVDMYLPLLEATQRLGDEPRKSSREKGVELETILEPMPYENSLLLEHILCFLLNVSRKFWRSTSDRQALARVWAPCLLRAPARVMGQFGGRPLETVASWLILLLEMRAHEGSHQEAENQDTWISQAIAPPPPPPPTHTHATLAIFPIDHRHTTPNDRKR